MDTVKLLAIIGGSIGVAGFAFLLAASAFLTGSISYLADIVGLIASGVAIFAPFYFTRETGLIIVFAVIAGIDILAGDIPGWIAGGVLIAAAVKSYSGKGAMPKTGSGEPVL